MASFETNEEVDYLEVDAPIPGQNFCCMSFISPEKVLEKKDKFIMNKFLKSLENENNVIEIKTSEFNEKYEDFVSVNNAKLDEEFHKENEFQTSIRGIKIRGVYNTYEEASKRANSLQKSDRSFHVFVGQVGYWLPWDPNADNVTEQEYLEKELNELMKNYKANQVQRDLFYSSQVEEHKRNAALESQKKKDALKSNKESSNNSTESVSETIPDSSS